MDVDDDDDDDDAVLLLFAISRNVIAMGVCNSGSGVGSLIWDGIIMGVATVLVAVVSAVGEWEDEDEEEETNSTTGCR